MNTYKGPQYRESSFRGVDEFTASCGDHCRGFKFGVHVKLSANGKRIFYTSLRDEGTVEVWDLDETTNEWDNKALLLPHDPAYNDDNRRLHENGTEVIGLGELRYYCRHSVTRGWSCYCHITFAITSDATTFLTELLYLSSTRHRSGGFSIGGLSKAILCEHSWSRLRHCV